MGRSAWVLSVIVLGVICGRVTAAEKMTTAAPPSAPASGVIESWLARSQAHAAKMDAGQRWHAAASLCPTYIALGRPGPAMEFVSKIEEDDQRVNAQLVVAAALADSRNVIGALRFAESLSKAKTVDQFGGPVASPRNRALFMIAKSQSRAHDFEGARQTIHRIDDAQSASAGWCRLAEAQGRAGLYDEGLKSLENVAAVEGKRKQEARQAIEKCRAEGRKEAAPPRATRYIEGLRAVLGLFGDVALAPGTLDQQEARINKLRGDVNRTSAWRQLAWKSYRAGDRPRCQRAIEECLKCAGRIPAKSFYLKAINDVLVADLYLELGMRKEAVETARRAISAPRPEDLIGEGLSAFTVAPLVVSVYVRTGHVAEAIETAKRIKEYDEATWTSLGVFSALEGDLKPIEHMLQTVSDERIRAIVCAGVAYGLHEKCQRGPR